MLDQYAMSKGLKMVDDDDEEAVTHHEMTADHELVIHIEHCKADRPSKMGSLKGCKENYETKARDIETVIKSLSRGAGTVSVHINEEKIHHELAGGPSPPAARGGKSPRAKSTPSMRVSVTTPLSPTSTSGTQTWRPPVRTRFGWQPQPTPEKKETWPRIGACEVTMQLRNTLLHTRYPTVTLASKIEAAMWPSKRLVAKRVEKSLQKLLADEKSEELRQEVARLKFEAAVKENEGTPRSVMTKNKDLKKKKKKVAEEEEARRKAEEEAEAAAEAETERLRLEAEEKERLEAEEKQREAERIEEERVQKEKEEAERKQKEADDAAAAAAAEAETSVKSPDRTSEGPISPPAGARPGGRKSLAERMAEKHGIALEQKG